MTDADFARATDWIAAYLMGTQQIEVSMGYADAADLACRTGCTSTPVAGGQLQDRSSLGWHEKGPNGTKTWAFVTQLVRGGFYVNVREQIAAPSLEEASAQRTLDHGAVVDLVTDPRLTFTHP